MTIILIKKIMLTKLNNNYIWGFYQEVFNVKKKYMYRLFFFFWYNNNSFSFLHFSPRLACSFLCSTALYFCNLSFYFIFPFGLPVVQLCFVHCAFVSSLLLAIAMSRVEGITWWVVCSVKCRGFYLLYSILLQFMIFFSRNSFVISFIVENSADTPSVIYLFIPMVPAGW